MWCKPKSLWQKSQNSGIAGGTACATFGLQQLAQPGGSGIQPAGLLAQALKLALGVILACVLFPSPAAAQNLLHIRVLEGEGAILSAGGKSSRGISVEITDETGRPVDSAAVSFRMPEEGPGAAFRLGMKTDIRTTTPDGRTSVHEFVANRIAGPFQVRVTAVKNGVRAGTIVSQYVSDQPASKTARAGSSKRKWIAILAVAGGAAAGGVAAMSGSRGSSPAAAATGTAAAPPQIGAPTFSIGGPQ